jgi:hypothetical protein
MGLEISEIEGDAILFYKFGDPPDLKELYKQVQKMFCAFHQNIIAYDSHRFCQCRGCTSAVDLTLKIVTHYGEFTDYHVKNFKKLIGKDVIVAHQLLKNQIEKHEYWLVTKKLLQHTPTHPEQWLSWNSSVKETESGEIPFQYTPLSELKNNLVPEPIAQADLQTKVKMITVCREYEAGIINLFHAVGDFQFRSRWFEGLDSVEEVNHFLPRVGMRCRYKFRDGQAAIYTSSYSYHPDRIEFTETDEITKSSTNYLLEKQMSNRTKLTIEFYIKGNIAAQFIFGLAKKKKLESTLQKSMLNLEELVKEINIPDEVL